MTFTGIITVIKGLIGLVSKAFTYFNNKTLKKAGADEAELESRKRDDKIIADINAKRGDKRVRDSVRKKYTR